MELELNNYDVVGLWWEDRSGKKGLSTWSGDAMWGFAISGNSPILHGNPDLTNLFETYEEAKAFMHLNEWVKFIIGGWIYPKSKHNKSVEATGERETNSE